MNVQTNHLKLLFIIAFLLLAPNLFSQADEASNYGFRHLQTNYDGDPVDILVWSKKGEEMKKKPLFLFIQGSLPVPLIIKYEEGNKKGIYHVFVFNPDIFSDDYHLAIIAKPYIPLIAEQKTLGPEFTYRDSTGHIPEKYVERNLPDYYVNRDIAVIKFLQSLSWVSDSQLVVAGHSEGSTIAARIAVEYPKVTRLIYSGGDPCGRILSIIESRRAYETDSNKLGEEGFRYWENIVKDSSDMDGTRGDTYKSTYEFSIPPMNYLEKLTIPVLISYGTKDAGCVCNDFFRTRMIQRNKKNFTFTAYIGVEHNYFPLKTNGETNYDVFNWDKVALNWRYWLRKQ
jgi:dienelactone hydrolase